VGQDPRRFGRRQPSEPFASLGKRLTLEKLHGDVGHVVVDAVIEDLYDVGTPEGGGSSCLAQKPGKRLRV
jgi:hypothetical protein